uniref:Uncharacterized protein n=1 Tax=Triticum urartu TaxID=4572 RepID=A0A8R7U6B7_TRIUA
MIEHDGQDGWKEREGVVECFGEWRCKACAPGSRPMWLDDLNPSNGTIELYAKIMVFGKLSCLSRRVDPLTMRLVL